MVRTVADDAYGARLFLQWASYLPFNASHHEVLDLSQVGDGHDALQPGDTVVIHVRRCAIVECWQVEICGDGTCEVDGDKVIAGNLEITPPHPWSKVMTREAISGILKRGAQLCYGEAGNADDDFADFRPMGEIVDLEVLYGRRRE